MPNNSVNIAVSVWNFGCLGVLLTREIAAVERQLRAGMSPEEAETAGVYLEQLRGCLRSVREVSMSPLSAKEVEAIKAEILGVKAA